MIICPECGLNPNDEQPTRQQKWEEDYVKANGRCSACQQEREENQPTCIFCNDGNPKYFIGGDYYCGRCERSDFERLEKIAKRKGLEVGEYSDYVDHIAGLVERAIVQGIAKDESDRQMRKESTGTL